jgi:hypothetical protein
MENACIVSAQTKNAQTKNAQTKNAQTKNAQTKYFRPDQAAKPLNNTRLEMKSYRCDSNIYHRVSIPYTDSLFDMNHKMVPE